MPGSQANVCRLLAMLAAALALGCAAIPGFQEVGKLARSSTGSVSSSSNALPLPQQVEGPSAVAHQTLTHSPGSERESASPELVAPLPDSQGEPDTLEAAWQKALSSDHGQQAARHEVAAARETLAAARAQRWPDVVVEADYRVQDNERAFEFDTNGFPLPSNVFPFQQDEGLSTRASAALPLYTSGRIGNEIEAARKQVSASGFNEAAKRAELKLRVAAEYFDVLRAESSVRLAASRARSLEAHQREVQQHHRREQVSQNELLEARVALARARHDWTRALHRLDLARAAFNRRLGRPLDHAVTLVEPAVAPPSESLEAWTERALGQRPELFHLRAKASSLDLQAERERALNRPQVELRGEHVFQENRFQTPEGIAALSAGASWNLFDGGRRKHAARSLAERAEHFRHLEADLASRIRLQVRSAWRDIEETRQRVAVAQQAVRQAAENLRVARSRFGSEMATSAEVLQAETLLARNRQALSDAHYDSILAAFRLRWAAGTL